MLVIKWKQEVYRLCLQEYDTQKHPKGISSLRSRQFKRDAVAQITDRGYSVKEVAERLGICTKSLYDWKRQFHKHHLKNVS
ncbi:MAG: transposase, partial [Emcibacteraceae bacterium]|nr:transposase [Emcibacteraceae bacterium]